MNLINEKITHDTFGTGSIIEQDESFITVDFEEDLKKFVYPDSIGTYVMLTNEKKAKKLEKVVSEQEAIERELEKKRREKEEALLLQQQRKARLKNNQIHESSQIVFWLD